MDTISAQRVRPKKVLILSDDPSGGHKAAARAVLEALATMPEAESKFMEFHELCATPRRWFREQQFTLARTTFAPISRFMFHHAMHPNRLLYNLWDLTSRMNNWSILRLRNQAIEEHPNIVLSVHMSTNYFTNIWEQQGKLHAPVHSVVTDYLAHAIWASENIQRYYVATDGVKGDLMNYGVPAERILVTGIPISPRFAVPDTRSPEEVKHALGLIPDLPVILLMGGSRGDQQYEPILRAMELNGTKAQVVVLCGRNAARKEEVEQLASSLRFPVFAKGFQTNMPDWYHAADLVITKPGGLTTSEVLAKGKPLILVSPYPGMEEVQVGRLTEAGVAVYGKTPEEAAAHAQQILNDSSLQRKLANAAIAFRKPDAAFTIARDLIQSAARQSPTPGRLRCEGENVHSVLTS